MEKSEISKELTVLFAQYIHYVMMEVEIYGENLRKYVNDNF